ncbi:heme ABC transporter permease [Thiorhodospira sibirica]|uniref:heme ABC transporter permease n=1 Tax=Thiorhodospira sibirica TaxID=154347 RepID=UPI00022C2861|nr:heme ABC transporter permease [Thiorhodospira sibirica]
MAEKSIQWFKFASPARFYDLTGRLVWGFGILAAVLFVVGLYMGFVLAPPDYQQGNSYRIIFIHVPSAWMAMFLYVVMAIYAAVGLIWRIKTAEIMAKAIAPTGALMAFLALWTGAVWGKPTWGAFWVWDARLTSSLILFFMYLGFIALHAAIEDRQRAANASAVLALVGIINVPIIYFSVHWWNTLHQGATIKATSAPSMAAIMFFTVIVMVFAYWMYSIAAVLARARLELLEREKHAAWVSERLNLPRTKETPHA